MIPRLAPLCLAVVAALPACASRPAPPSGDGVRLVLQVTVDGLRYDLLTRNRAHFGEGGFARFFDDGVVFTDARYRHANTETIVGHTVLATGAQPAVHGMTGNVWYDPDTEALGYNVEDPDFPLLPLGAGSTEGEQVDPTQAMARSDGRSPRAVLAPSFSDVLLAATGGQAKVFGVSCKDRGAIPLAGHGGTAFWFLTDVGQFVTSRYYAESYPDWVADWHAADHLDDWGDTTWELRDEPASYRLADRDDRPFEVDLRGYGRVFPHRYAPDGDPMLATQVLVGPAGNDMLASFAEELLVHEGLGQDDVPDYLSVSFSGVDYVNHLFGPSSLENEDVVRRLDDTLAQLLDFVDREVGLEHVVMVLSADHGMPEAPEQAAADGMNAGRLTADDVLGAVRGALEEQGLPPEAVRFYFRPFVYLDHDVLRAAGREPDAVAQLVGQAVGAVPGVHLGVTRQGLADVPDVELVERLRNTWHPRRSGDVYVVQEPFWCDLDEGPLAVMHGSPWRYDTHVPVMFAGAGVGRGVVSRPIQPADVAPTLAGLLGLTPPAMSTGDVLPEVVGRRRHRH